MPTKPSSEIQTLVEAFSDGGWVPGGLIFRRERKLTAAGRRWEVETEVSFGYGETLRASVFLQHSLKPSRRLPLDWPALLTLMDRTTRRLRRFGYAGRFGVNGEFIGGGQIVSGIFEKKLPSVRSAIRERDRLDRFDLGGVS